MTRPPRLTEPLLRTNLRKYYGNIQAVADATGTARQSVYEAIAKNERLKIVKHQAEEALTDRATAALARAIERDEPWAIKTQLASRSGRARGYFSHAPDDVFAEQLDALEAGVHAVEAQLLAMQADLL